MAPENDAAALLAAHRYDEALEQYERAGSKGDTFNKAITLLCIGRLEEALEQFQIDRSLQMRDVRGNSGVNADFIGTTLWLLGREKQAIKTFEAAISGILDGSIRYGDGAGGVSQGLLLWYASLSAGDKRMQSLSLKYLRNRTKRKAVKNWPGPLAQFILGRISDSELLKSEFGSSGSPEIDKLASSDFLKRRSYVNSLFYIAIRERGIGNMDTCDALMRRCALLENPQIEPEWYLARRELDLDFHWRPSDHSH